MINFTQKSPLSIFHEVAEVAPGIILKFQVQLNKFWFNLWLQCRDANLNITQTSYFKSIIRPAAKL